MLLKLGVSVRLEGLTFAFTMVMLVILFYYYHFSWQVNQDRESINPKPKVRFAEIPELNVSEEKVNGSNTTLTKGVPQMNRGQRVCTP